MIQSVEAVERHIDQLRAAVRRAVVAGERSRARTLRAELRDAERAWEQALTALHGEIEPSQPIPAAARPTRLLPIREQVQHALTLLSVPAAPKLIAEVHTAFFGPAIGGLSSAKLTHLRRDEERSFRSSPYTRTFYLCAALTAERLTPARGLLAVSTWPLPRRMIGPLSPRVDFLTAAANLARQAAQMPQNDGVARLLRRFAATLPGVSMQAADPMAIAEAAHAELKLHIDADRKDREAAAEHARAELNDLERLFGRRGTRRTEKA